MNEQRTRIAELIGGLSLATDLAAGMGYESALRTCLLAVRIGAALGIRGPELQDIYYTAMLRYIGCTAYAHETADRYAAGDDQRFLREMSSADVAKPRTLLSGALRGLGRDAGLPRQGGSLLRVATNPKVGQEIAAAHCALAVALAGRLGMRAEVVAALRCIYERYDGKGAPHGIRGEAIPLPARVLHVAWRVQVQRALDSPRAAVAAVRERRGSELDPAVCDAFLAHARAYLEETGQPSVWDAVLAAEPRPYVEIDADGVEGVAEAFAAYVDIKSPYTLNHSGGVARLADGAAERMGLAADERRRLRIAALLHDLGRVSVPNGIWDKRGPLNPVEWSRVRQHAAQSEAILSFSPLLQPYAPLVAGHHERLDGSGYHRGIGEMGLGRAARILAAADTFQALTEERPHRPAHAPEIAARIVMAEARAGRLDREAAEAVLAAAGQAQQARQRGERPAGLTEREVEVLALLARGLTNKEIGGRLRISPRTVQNHLLHIFEKTGVNTRAAAAVYAVTHDLVR